MITNGLMPHDDGLAKYAATLFENSRSCVTRTSSRFSRASSSSCGLRRPFPRKRLDRIASDFLLPAPQQIGRDTEISSDLGGRTPALYHQFHCLALELPCKRSSHLPHVHPLLGEQAPFFSRCPPFQGKIKACWFRVRGAKMCHRACRKRIHYDTIPNHSLYQARSSTGLRVKGCSKGAHPFFWTHDSPSGAEGLCASVPYPEAVS